MSKEKESGHETNSAGDPEFYDDHDGGEDVVALPTVAINDLPCTSRGIWPRDHTSEVSSENEQQNQHDVEPNVVFRTVDKNEEIADERLANWLKKAENEKFKDFIMTTPPIRPKGGEIFLYRCKRVSDEDYRRDGYTGMASSYNNNRFNSKLHRIAFQLRDEKKKPIPGFKKQVVSLRKSLDKPNKIKLLWYSGDESIWKPRSHGNSLDKDRQFTSNTAACRASIQQMGKISGKAPMLVYRTLLQNAVDEPFFEQRQEIVGPRNKKQVQNGMQSMRTKNRVHEDEILAVYLMGRSKMFGEFIREMKLLDREAIILADTETLNLTKALIKEASDSTKNLPLCFGFDTTFSLADAYISPLVARNAFLEGNPIFPCAFLVHERRTHDVHRFFWDTMKTLLPLDSLPLTVPIVSDREAGLLKGMYDSLGLPGQKFHHVPCTIHIKRDCKQWLLDQKAPSVDVSTYVREVDQLLQCESEENFEEMYVTVQDTWSVPFVEYVELRLKTDMKRAARFFAKQFPAFVDVEATSNFVESMNSILKHSAQWKTLRLDSIVMNLFNLTMSYLGEFDRAYKGIGNYRPKAQYSKRRPGFKLPAYAYWTEEKFLGKFRENYEQAEQLAPETLMIRSAKALARIACEMNYVTLNSQSLSFTVTGPYDGKKAIVEEDDDGRLICSCEGPGLCFHKEAYLRVTKKVVQCNRTTYKLSTLRRKTRQTKGPSGRKKIAPLDIETVIPAPDSRAAQRTQDLEDQIFVQNNEQHVGPDANIASVNATSQSEAQELANSSDCEPLTPKLKRARTEVVQHRSDDSLLNGRSEEHGDDIADQNELQMFPGSALSFLFPDSEDDDDQQGLHFYSQRSSTASTASKISTTGSWTAAHETPELFTLPTADFKVCSTVYKGIKKSLLRNKMLATGTVDNACALWIKVHDFEDSIAFGSTVDFANSRKNSFDSLRRLVSWAQRSEALNSDLVLVPLYISEESQFALGVIIWKSNEILVIDSGSKLSTYAESIFEALTRMAYASQLVADCPNSHLKWTYLLEQNMDTQTDSVSSGVLCILNAFAVCSRQSFWRCSRAVSIHVMRKWIAKCLSNAPDENIRLRDGQPVRRLTPFQRTKMADYLKCLEIPPISIAQGSYLSKVKKEIGSRHFKKGKCDLKNCQNGNGSNQDNIITCCLCRRWFHLVSCVQTGVTSVAFYYCQGCEPSHRDYAQIIAQKLY